MPAETWTIEQVESDDVSKKDLVTFLHDHATYEFLKERKLYGKLANIVKASKKPALVVAYKDLFKSGAFRPEGQSLEIAAAAATAQDKVAEKDEPVQKDVKQSEIVPEEPAKFTKIVLKKGDGERKPKKGDTVHVFYTGTLTDGTVFDTNLGKKKPVPLRFKVGVGRVIRGWDEGLLTMYKGEKARLIIESDWAYGKKGTPDGRIPPNTPLVFEVELVGID